ncbi:MAG TPA: hypothetical protein VGL39_13675 [Jatrophihabitantaceae bacterium]
MTGVVHVRRALVPVGEQHVPYGRQCFLRIGTEQLLERGGATVK